MSDLLTFLLAGLAVVLAGVALARAADAIGAATGIGRLWIGTILLALGTSLPELVTDVSAVRLGLPNLAAGDLFGSSLANMLILGVIDLLPPRVGVLRSVALGHALSACTAILLTCLAAAFVFVQLAPAAGGVGLGASLLLVLYLAGARAGYLHQRTAGDLPPPPTPRARARLGWALAGFALAAAVVLAAAPRFAASAGALAHASGLGTTFFGTALVGLATSLPELASSIAAVRMRAYDLAVGNLFGSNACNMLVLFAMDLAHPGSIFLALHPAHALTALFGVALMALGLAAIVFRADRIRLSLEPSSLLVVLGYFLALGFLWTATAPVVAP